jgi:hypothetical protein
MKVFETLQDPRLNKQLFYVSSPSPFSSRRVDGDSLDVYVSGAKLIFMQPVKKFAASYSIWGCISVFTNASYCT